MESQGLSREEQEIVKRFRQLNTAQKKAVQATEDAFISFLQTIQMIVEIWYKIAPIVRDIWHLLKAIS
jgi:hypothetical protein